ncbi:repressor LexA [Candidatus Nomurabacteria bacterium]|nr:repressor LexA [Candidatus Nomurabacteria bacterium]
MLNKQLTKKQAEILGYIKNFYHKNNYSPALSNIAEYFEVSIPTIHQHIDYLKRKGYLKTQRGIKHSIQMTDDDNQKNILMEIPLLGTIAAGQPIEAIEEPEPITVPKTMLSGSGEHFALRVSGDSMIGDGIFNRDIVIIRKQEFANNGDTIVAIINGNEATLKKLYKEKNGFRLQPANPNIEPIFTKELLVQGKVISILRNIENELIATPIQKNNNYIKSDEYVDEDSLRILSDSILKFKEENLFSYKSEKILDILILQEIFLFLIKKQGANQVLQYEMFKDTNINVELTSKHKSELQKILSALNVLTNSNDVLGHIYQSIQSQENRKDAGQYYTPNKVVDFIIDSSDIDLTKNKDLKILDPSCGSGQFLLRAYEKLLKQYGNMGVNENLAHKNIVEKHLFGVDVDPIACILTRANLVLKNPFVPAKTNVFINDFLKKDYGLIEKDPFDSIYKQFDFVVGNPPWGASLSKESKKYYEKYYAIGEVGLNTFTLFIERSLDFLKNKGKLGFLMPEAYLKIKVHRPSRKQLLSNGEIKLLAISGDIFKKVYAPSLVLVFEKSKNINKNNKILIQEGVFNGKVRESEISQSLFENTPDNIFNIHSSDLSTKIIQQIDMGDKKYLKNNTLFVLGIVTGNNNKHLLPKRLSKKHEPIIVGKDLRKFKIDFSGKHFLYDKNTLQQVAPRSYYESSEKLIYKFIGKNLTFSYDNQKRFCLNNANAIVPNIPNIQIKYVLGILNSEIIQFYYSKSFFTVRVLRSNLERLPIFNATKAQQKKVISFVEKIEKAEGNKYRELLQEMNNFIFELYHINEQQKEYIREELGKL